MATGQSGTVKRATLEEVRERLASLVERKREREEKVEEVDLDKRLEKRKVEEEMIKEEKRRVRNEKRRKGGKGDKDGNVQGREVGVKVEDGDRERDRGIIC